MGFKDMIARCMARFRRGECARCDNRDNCVFHQAGAFGVMADRSSEVRPPHPSSVATSFTAFLGEVVRAIADRSAPANPFRGEVERRMEAMLATGEVRIDRVAADMGLSRQTLYRRLKEEGATFEELLDGLRHRLALRYLRADQLSVKAAAYRLGFSDPAAFSRAFKRWTGSSPRTATA